MILKSKHHPVISPFFKWYSRVITRRHFSKVVIEGVFKDSGKPILLISNHFSWWDGFWALNLSAQVLQRKFHFMMLEEQLRKHWYFNYIGGFSIARNRRTMLESLQYASDLLRNPANLVLMYPQGEIQSMHTTQLQFGKGVERILAGKAGEVQIMFLANVVDYFSKKRPSLVMYLEEYTGEDVTADTIKTHYNTFLNKSLLKQQTLKEAP
jgi:1-acyl-sn-glycerol-3-phosphate acyltransferase